MSIETQTVNGDQGVQEASEAARRLIDEVGTVVVGQREMIERLLIGLLCGGHVLLEGVPGLAKTLAVSTLARGLDATFSRIQFTPDLLPADVVGTQIYHPSDHTFTSRKGPVFANLLLADEINRAPAKVQSALLEAMQERQVTIGDETFALPDPFLVLATQNPIEQEGTYPLPEAQVDRFMLKLRVEYPSGDEERTILDRFGTSDSGAKQIARINPVLGVGDVARLRSVADGLHVDESIKDYIVSVVRATRDPKPVSGLGANFAGLIEFGASPRAGLALLMAGKAHALLDGRGYVTPADVKAIGHDVLRHRVIESYEAQAEGLDSDFIVGQIFDHVPVP